MSAPPPDDVRDEPADRVQLSLPQVAGSSLAALSAAVVCSYFGVAGTIIGTAVTSAVVTIGSALYAYSLRRTQARLRRLHQAGAAAPPVTAVLRTAQGQGKRLLRRIPWRIVLLGTANVFVFAIAFVTGLEAILGRSLSSELGVSHGGSHQTTLNSIFGSGHKKKATPSTPTPSPTPTAVTTATSSTPPTGSPAPASSSAAPLSSPSPSRSAVLSPGLPLTPSP